MRRHALDAISFVFGLIFLAVAALGMAGELALSGRELEWAGAGVLLVVGLVLLLGARSNRERGATPAEVPQERRADVPEDAEPDVPEDASEEGAVS
jgi:hypothetical protein